MATATTALSPDVAEDAVVEDCALTAAVAAVPSDEPDPPVDCEQSVKV